MKKNLKLFILSILIIGISIILINDKRINNNILENNNEEKKVVYNGLAIMLEQEDGSYSEAQDDTWKTGYEFNTTLSKCENGGTLTYDSSTHKITLKATGSDRCYVYFSKKIETLEEHIIAQVGKDISSLKKDTGYNEKKYLGELIYHDSNATDNIIKQYGAADEGYRYTGDNPNNFVCFGPGAEDYSKNESETCKATNLYRIIGIVPVDVVTTNDDGTETTETQNLIKLIQSEYATTSQLGISSDGTPGTGSYTSLKRVKVLPTDGFKWNSTQSSTYYNIWADDTTDVNKNATLNKALNDSSTGYLHYLDNSQKVAEENQQGIDWAEKIETVKWNIAGGNTSELYDATPKTAYDVETSGNTAGSNKATQTTSTAKIGLMYVHDYGFASDKSNWKTNLSGYNTNDNRSKNWLFNGVYEWTISCHSETSNGALYVYNDGYVVNGYVNTNEFGVRPTFYLNEDIQYVGGDGTAKTPYKISIN